MGVVYKAEDLRLKRPVALKFLPSELTRDADARERFEQEAQAASLLDHPNICTIYEIDTTDDNQLFIAMAYIGGETLKKRLQAGPLPIDQAIDIASQIARGLAKAHEAGIVHRDIKPANVMLTNDGVVKIVDFGIAKLMDRTGPTRAGTTLGTVMYMAPEQVRGAAVDHRADLWATGVVLYEMLTARSPFGGDNELAVFNNIATLDAVPPSRLRAEIPTAVDRLVMRALEKLPERRYQSAGEFIDALTRTHEKTVDVVARPSRASAPVTFAAALVLVVAGLAGGWMVTRNAASNRTEGALGELQRVAANDQYVAGFARAQALEATIAGDRRLEELWDAISTRRSIVSEPPEVDVYIRAADDLDSQWISLGRTPLENVRVPRGILRVKAEKQGFETREFLFSGAGPAGSPQTIQLVRVGAVPDGMLIVPRGNLALRLTGYDYSRTWPSASYAISRAEVTNKQFKEFVDAGGYMRQAYWKHSFVKDGDAITWSDAMAVFTDRTGRSGPATWEAGSYAAGTDDYPVGGISWYEAAAYAEFVGKNLPTVYHWVRAAGIDQAAAVTPLSNLNGKGPAAVGSFRAVGPVGAVDMAGNLKEWCWNQIAGSPARFILGGSWADPPHMFVYADARSPFDRSEVNGVRLVDYLGETVPSALAASIEPPTRDYQKEVPVSDQVFEIFRSLYAYDATPLDARVESKADGSASWAVERVSFTAANGADRVPAILFLPKNASPPYQTVVLAPGAGALVARSSSNLALNNFDFLLSSGRAVLLPIYQGTYERGIGRTSPWPDTTRAYKDWMVQVVNDARRSVDYLESRADIKHGALAFFGVSWGAMWGANVLALERRFKVGVLSDGGLTAAKKPAEVDQFNFAPRVSMPVLMLNGDSDFIYPTEASQKPLFRILGTPAADKRQVILRSGHGVLGPQRSQAVREILDWLDKYLD
jgi:dienelactone hydrolase